MEDKSLTTSDSYLGLNHDILDKLETYEDYLSFYIQLDQASTAFAWTKADLLFQMVQKLGEPSVEQLARDVKHPRSTVVNYVRVARAFPIEKRDPAASFSLHFRASFADAYDDKTHTFTGEKRFKWLDKALDEGMSTRVLSDAIKRDKKKTELNVNNLPCSRCNKADEGVKPYIMYSPGSHLQGESFDLHDNCYNRVIEAIYGRT
jgi:hypothetical protein